MAKKRPYRPARRRHHGPAQQRGTAPAAGPAEPTVKPEIAAIIGRTRAATTKGELLEICQEAIHLQPQDAETLEAFYLKRIAALPAITP